MRFPVNKMAAIVASILATGLEEVGSIWPLQATRGWRTQDRVLTDPNYFVYFIF